MDGREIDDVETHRLGVVDPPEAIAKSRAAIGPAFGGAREKFIPGGGARRDAIDDHAGRRGVLGRAVVRGVGCHQNFQFAGVREPVDERVSVPPRICFGKFAQAFRVGPAGAFGGGGEERGALQFFARQIGQAGFEFGRKFVLPAAEDIGPGFDRVFVGGVFVDGKNSAPAIVLDQLHGGLVPVRLAEHPPFQGRPRRCRGRP